MKIFLKGGLEQYFSNQTNITLEYQQILDNNLLDFKDLVRYLKETYPSCNTKLFRDDELMPGNICLFNGIEHEILGGGKAKISNDDSIYFISSMHGG